MNNINNFLNTAIVNSQHCQRNWDLDKSILPEDLNTLVKSVTECPSKQNIAYYKCHFIFNRSVIKNIHSNTDGFTVSHNPKVTETNTQTLANLVVAFEDVPITARYLQGVVRNDQALWMQSNNGIVHKDLKRDKEMAIGIASGYLNLTANLLGYSTGYCACFDSAAIKEILGLNNNIILMLGIGFKNELVDRKQHHLNPKFMYPTLKKQPIDVNFIS